MGRLRIDITCKDCGHAYQVDVQGFDPNRPAHLGLTKREVPYRCPQCGVEGVFDMTWGIGSEGPPQA